MDQRSVRSFSPIAKAVPIQAVLNKEESAFIRSTIGAHMKAVIVLHCGKLEKTRRGEENG